MNNFTILQFSCNLKLLSQTINNVCLAINKKINPLPILDGILMECENNVLKLTGFDLNLAIIKNLEVKIVKPGNIVLNAQLFADILRKMKGPEVIISCNTDLKITIEDSETNYTIIGINSDQFPKVFSLISKNKFSLKNSILKDMIFQTSYAVSQNASQNPILCGSLFKINNNMFSLVSLDGYRVAISKRLIENCNFNSNFVVSSKTLNEVFKLLTNENDDEKIEIEFDEKYASFKINGYNILTRLLEGQFLNYEAAIPKTSATTLIVDPKEFALRIERVSVMVTNRISVLLKINGDKVKLTCESSLGNVNDVLTAQVEGADLDKIAFNFKYMLDALKHTQCDRIKILFNDALSPIKIEPEEGDSFLFLVLPVRV